MAYGRRNTARVRERDVTLLVSEGLSNEDIAERPFLGVRTVQRHLSNAYSKPGVSGRAARFSQVG